MNAQNEEKERITCPECNLSATVTAWKNAGGRCPSTNGCYHILYAYLSKASLTTSQLLTSVQ